MRWSRVGILCAVSMGAALAVGRAQTPPVDSHSGPASIGQSRAPKRAPAHERPDFGTATTVWHTIPASDFDPDTACASGCTDYTSTWNPSLGNYNYRRYVTAGQPRLFGSPRLPGGALLQFIEYDYCDNNGAGRLVFNVYICDYLGVCSQTPYHTYTTAGTDGCAAAIFPVPPYTVDNFGSKILVEVGWGVSDDTLQLAGVSFAYTLQVSPAPGVATFNDVPTTDPFFQFIEALVSAGITGGCGGGNFCPDAPVTRRQMAVFLAKSLGLNWGQ